MSEPTIVRAASDKAAVGERRSQPVVNSAMVTSLVEDNIALVGHLVREMMPRLPGHVNRDDLISAGMAALVVSAQGFDPSREVPFARFAAIRIRGALLDELRSMDWASRSVRGRSRDVESVQNQLAATLNRSPRPQEVAAALGMSVSEVASIQADVSRASVLSLQAFAPDSGAASLPDSRRNPEQLVLEREQLGYLHDAIDELPERLRFVVRSYFFEQRQMSDIAADLGVTESRISQLRAEALKLLRQGVAGLITEAEPAVAGGGDSGRREARVASYAAAVAARGTVATRLQRSTAWGETVHVNFGRSSIA